MNDGQPGINEIPAEVRPGGYEAAIEHAEDDNLTHGKPLSHQDKRNMFERRLARGHRWSSMSSRAIARELGVGRRTIDRWRAEWEENWAASGPNGPVEELTTRIGAEQTGGPNGPGDQPVTRIGADGKAYNIGGIQDANRQRVQGNDQQRTKPAVTEGPEREDDPVEIVVTQILHTLRERGSLSPSLLKRTLGYDVPYGVYNQAMDRLLDSGAVERVQDSLGGLVTYQLRDVQTHEVTPQPQAAVCAPAMPENMDMEHAEAIQVAAALEEPLLGMRDQLEAFLEVQNGASLWELGAQRLDQIDQALYETGKLLHKAAGRIDPWRDRIALMDKHGRPYAEDEVLPLDWDERALARLVAAVEHGADQHELSALIYDLAREYGVT